MINSIEHLKLDVLLATISYLMSRYALRGERELAQLVSLHLDILSKHPDCLSRPLLQIARDLSQEWRNSIVLESMQDKLRH